MNHEVRRGSRAALLLLAALAAAPGCRKKEGDAGSGAAAPAGSEGTPALPPLVLKDDTPNALLTWVDDEGDFHVVDKVESVPEASRGAVRVVLADRVDGTGQSVYVADLRTKRPDGSYEVKTLTRAAWDETGASKRKARLEALAPSAAPPAASGSAAPAVAHGAVSAIVYGASWCGPCHQAEALLKSLGVKVTMKDIEKSDDAQREMQEKLRLAHRSGGSIPVIDVGGRIFVGFSASALRAAVDEAGRGQTL